LATNNLRIEKKLEKKFDTPIKKVHIGFVMNTTNNQTNPYATQALIGRFVSKEQITLIFSEDTAVIDNSNPKFNDILQLCKEGKYAEAAGLATIKNQINQTFDGSVEVVGGEVLYDGKPLHNVMCERILDIMREGLDATGLVKFLENVMENPSYTAVQELYLFLEANQIPITEDGHFLAWKKIRGNWKDIHSNSVDYSVGATPTMKRNEVDPDRDRTCSNGLHCAGWSYLPHFGSNSDSTDRIVIVKVNPADVIAVPKDYNNAKMRVCQMEVLREYTDRKVEAEEFSHSVVSSDGEPLYTENDLDEAYSKGYEDAYNELAWDEEED
jgi:hypothetical protein